MPMMMNTWAEWISGNGSHDHESVVFVVSYWPGCRRSQVPVKGHVFNTDCQLATTWVVSSPVAEPVE